MDLSAVEKNFNNPNTQKIYENYSVFMDTIRRLIDEIRKNRDYYCR